MRWRSFTWKGGAGSFSDPGQWNEAGGPPGAGDDAFFLVDGIVQGNGSVADVKVDAADIFQAATIDVAGAITVGDGGTGILIAEGGSFTTASATLGTSSTDFGQLLFEGSTFTVDGLFSVGEAGIGIVTATNATVATGDAIVGDAGSGSDTNINSTVTVTGDLTLGNQSAGVGTYSLTGNTGALSVDFNTLAESPNGALIVGLNGAGTFTQGSANDSDPGNTVSIAGDLVLGEQEGSLGTYTINDGTLTVGGKLVVGASSVGTNTFTQNGGLVQITGSAASDPNYVGVINSDTAVLDIGFAGGNGTYVIAGGTLETFLIQVGQSGIGRFDQNGGDVDLSNGAGWLWIADGIGSRGSYSLSGNAT